MRAAFWNLFFPRNEDHPYIWVSVWNSPTPCQGNKKLAQIKGEILKAKHFVLFSKIISTDIQQLYKKGTIIITQNYKIKVSLQFY